MPHDMTKAPLATIPGWQLWLSDAGRFWATRDRPFTVPQMRAGAERTVDADDLGQLLETVAAQEARAEQAVP
ncbi:hypothetical protein OG320_16460 [Microbispora sp. NBC_01189]|uniref:hypothetical protein n=1 Tax=Microbispora sp. NBC_01189 TaxID=2903583 RepID=UPI002E1506BE|nr:hypothetical protein OG320_16460 [Microbispora sp. NBC_01189]